MIQVKIEQDICSFSLIGDTIQPRYNGWCKMSELMSWNFENISVAIFKRKLLSKQFLSCEMRCLSSRFLHAVMIHATLDCPSNLEKIIQTSYGTTTLAGRFQGSQSLHGCGLHFIYTCSINLRDLRT